MGARNRGGRGLSYRPARIHRLAEFIPWNHSGALYTFKNTGSVLYIYHCVQKRGDQSPVSKYRGFWRLLDEQNREAAETVCTRENAAC
jgi:hypothetical protein